jgi:uncharacterized protein (TIGR02246 family)
MKALAVAGLVLAVSASLGSLAATAPGTREMEIEQFNRKLREATLRMDNAALMALWDNDGVCLLPGLAPMVGKKSIGTWLDEIVRKMPGYRVTKQVNVFHDIQVSGNWASEWGETHQIVSPPDGKAPIESRGKILLVLRRGLDGEWRIVREMWNPGPPE